MNKRTPQTVLTMILTLFFFIACSSNDDNLPVTMQVYSAPIPVSSNGQVNVAYEIDFSPYTEQGLELTQVDVIDNTDETVIESYSGDALALHLKLPESPLPTEEEKWTGTKKQSYPVLYIWLKLDPSDVPAEIAHRFVFVNALNSDARRVLSGAVTPVNTVSPVVISPPMQGQGWLTLETTELLTHHFKNEVTYRNEPWHPERYAVDYMQVDPDNNFFTGDETRNDSWVCYGKQIIAVADGVVTAVHEGVADNVPVGEVAGGMAITDMCGNYVIQEIGSGYFASYCHMIPGSIQVSVGQSVAKGDVIGLLGNSGNSFAPHLHFQISDGNSFIGSDGCPYVLDAFTVTGEAVLDEQSQEFIINGYAVPLSREYDLVENLKILSF